MDKHTLLLEGLDYIQIKRGPSEPTKLDVILRRRMDDFISKRLAKIQLGNEVYENGSNSTN